MYFNINNLMFTYCREQYNKAYENERSVEISLGRYFLEKFNDTIEIGAVLPYYGNDSHTIIDLTDEHPKSQKLNALDYDCSGKNILSISTIEHMMKREYNNGSNEDSIIFLNKVISQAKNYLITWAMDYNEFLDYYIRQHSEIPYFILKRVNWNNEWMVEKDRSKVHPFGHSDRPMLGFNNANAIFVATNLKQLL